MGIYAPNYDAAVEGKERFYEILTDEINKISNRKEIIIMGDFNGRTGKREKD